MRVALQDLPNRAPSPDLQMRLQILASRERSRRISRRTMAEHWEQWRQRTVLSLNNLLRPLMLPVAGGFASACLLFGMLVPDFAVVRSISNDVPTPLLYTQASVSYLMPIALSENEIEIDVHIDDQGRMTDYHVLSGQGLLRNEQMRRRLESTLLITQFNPATTFGQPTFGRVRVRLVRDEVDVKG